MGYVTHLVVVLVTVNLLWSFANAINPVVQATKCDDVLPPKNGKRFGDDFTIGRTVNFVCSSLYTLIGQPSLTCLPDGQWSSSPPTCEHLCVQVPCVVGTKCKLINRSPTCVCRDNMECSSRWKPVCGSNGVTYNNECIMKATACRAGKNIQTVAPHGCLPGDRCSITPKSKCRAAFDVYFYNVTAGKCKHMIAGGCHPSGWNGFSSRDDCKNYCDQDVCVLKPESGPCGLQLTRYYFDPQTKTCKTFQYGGCFGNANNFRTLCDCEKRCI